MKKENLLLLYLKSHIKIIILYFIFIIIFSVIFMLSNLSLDAVGYAAFLYLCVIFLFFIYDFYKYYKYHNALYTVKNNITAGIQNLPEPIQLIDKDYQELLNILYNDKVKLVSQADIKYKEMLEYYTLWVHQIKTPISAIKLILQSENYDNTSEMTLELFKIERYVEMVLQYLRLENISSDLLFEKYDLSDIVKQAVRKYSIFFIQKKIKLNFDDLNCTVITDEKWLVFVIEQILSNALKYTNSGQISIYMYKDKEKTLIIEDTGIGIQQEDLERVFEKGFTGCNGRMDKKSTGIGLYLCSKIIKKLSHKIYIDSTVGKGTKVIIDLLSYDIFIE